MAIHPHLTPSHSTPNAQSQAQSPASTPQIDIEAWTQQAADALEAVSISPAVAAVPTTAVASPPRGTPGRAVALAIPLDDHDRDHATDLNRSASSAAAQARPTTSTYARRREPLRRDSLKRREALLKGKEGSRRRQRWENDRLLHNPHVQPPLPSDWEVQPTYPRHTVPYYLAPLWDAHKAASASKKASDTKATTTTGNDGVGKVPRELREKLKRARGAKVLLQDLEEEVRAWVRQWEAREASSITKDHAGATTNSSSGSSSISEAFDSEDEEIVFVGRNGQMRDMPPSPRQQQQSDGRDQTEAEKLQEDKEDEEEELRRDKLIYRSLVDDQGASFGRWLVHSIASYYGLRTWSVTVGDPARREAYVGLKQPTRPKRASSSSSSSFGASSSSSPLPSSPSAARQQAQSLAPTSDPSVMVVLPRPLYGLV
ncbi:MAG: hypothetical protein M1819_003158 [Sarea resinae]|nr:MAG: hypothetical protein M1819_003158 [Sarea resinae]